MGHDRVGVYVGLHCNNVNNDLRLFPLTRPTVSTKFVYTSSKGHTDRMPSAWLFRMVTSYLTQILRSALVVMYGERSQGYSP